MVVDGGKLDAVKEVVRRMRRMRDEKGMKEGLGGWGL